MTRREGGAPSHSGVSRLERVSAKHPGRDRDESEQRVAVGRRVFLGVVGLGAVGIVFGAKVQSVIGNVVGSGWRFAAIRGPIPHLLDLRDLPRNPPVALSVMPGGPSKTG